MNHKRANVEFSGGASAALTSWAAAARSERMQRFFTKRIACGACRSIFTITSAASKFCKARDCISKRRKADRLALKVAKAKVPPLLPAGSDAHLEP